MSVKSFNFYKLVGFMFKLISLEMMEIFSHFQQLRFVENRFIILHFILREMVGLQL